MTTTTQKRRRPKRQPTQAQKDAARAKRDVLIARTKHAKNLIGTPGFADCERVNEVLVRQYERATGEDDFRSFARWKSAGYRIRKGEQGFPVWGRPREAHAHASNGAGEPDPGIGNGDSDDDTFRLFPLAYVYARSQVVPKGQGGDAGNPRWPNGLTNAAQGAPAPAPAGAEPVKRGGDEPKAATARFDASRADRLRTLADGMEQQIEDKMHPAIANQNPTPRRNRIVDGMRHDGETLRFAQTLMRAIADRIDPDTEGPAWLATLDPEPRDDVSKKAAIEYAQRNREQLASAIRAGGADRPQPIRAKIDGMTRGLTGTEIDGFFPTPPHLAQRLVQLSGVLSMVRSDPPRLRVLDPSAGYGAILQVAHDELCENGARGNVSLYAIERAPRLAEILNAQVEATTIDRVLHDDALTYEETAETDDTSPSQFDAILMNPPFEKSAALDHVLAAWPLVAPGGVLAAIVPESVFFRTDGDYPDFRDWLQSNGCTTHDVEAGAFSGTVRTTNVKTRIIVMRRPAES